MNNLFCIRICSSSAPSSGIYIKTNLSDYDLILLSHHSIINKDNKEEEYAAFYYDGEYQKIKIKEDKKYKEIDLIIAKVEKLNSNFRDKIENIFLEEAKEGEKLFIKGFPSILSATDVPFQKLDVTINDITITDRFHQFYFNGQNGASSDKDDTHGMSGSPIFKKDNEYIRLKGMYLEIGTNNNSFKMGNFLKIKKIKECLAEYCPNYAFGVSEILKFKIKNIILEIKDEVSETYGLSSPEEQKWRKRFEILNEIIDKKNDEIEMILKKMTCERYEVSELLVNPDQLKILTRCLLSALICDKFNINKEFFINYGKDYSFLSPSLVSAKPKVEITKVMEFLLTQPNYNEKKIFVNYEVSFDNCDICNINNDSQKQAIDNTTLLPREKPEHFMNFYSNTKIEIKCAGCFKNIQNTFYFERKEKWENTKKLEKSN